jgi:hypothetical protein
MIHIHKNAQRSVLSVVLTSILTTIHHVFRLGLGSLPMWMPIIMLPIGLAVLFKRSKFKNRWLLAAYGLVSYAIIGWFGIMDGLFDHTFRVLGLNNITWLPGGDVEFVKTAFLIGSVETSHWIFQITGSFAFIASLFALFFTSKFIVGRLLFDATRQGNRKQKENQESSVQGSLQ